MKNKIIFLLISLTSTQAAFAESAQPDFKEGLWEITSSTKISGLPGMPEPATPISTSSTQCMKKQDAADPKTMMQNKDCNLSDLKTTANSVEWKMSCQQEGTSMKGTGKMNYHAESYDGVMTMEMQGSDVKMVTSTEIKGHYVGACK